MTPPTLADILARPRVPWARMDAATIEAVAYEARLYGDAALYRRAIRALRRHSVPRAGHLAAGDHVAVRRPDGTTVRGWIWNRWPGGGAILIDDGSNHLEATERQHAGHGPGTLSYDNGDVIAVLSARGPLRRRAYRGG